MLKATVYPKLYPEAIMGDAHRFLPVNHRKERRPF